MEEMLGKYRDPESKQTYTVLKRTEDIIEASVTETSKVIDSVSNYVTTCGRHLEPKDDDLKVFTFDEYEGTIYEIDD